MAVAIDGVDRCRPFAGMTRIRFGGLATPAGRALSDARTPGNFFKDSTDMVGFCGRGALSQWYNLVVLAIAESIIFHATKGIK
jgi:hypothetical protein